MTFSKFDSLLSQRDPQSQRKGTNGPEKSVILVVDDDPAIRTSLSVMLAGRYDILLASSAADGLRTLRDEVCAVILDIKMKGENGFWACDRMRERSPLLPIIFYSAFQDVKDPYRIINEHRPFAYLTKGGDPKDLLDALELAVRLYSLVLQSRRATKSVVGDGQPTSVRPSERNTKTNI
ncbi:MAG TPA: response regulator [Polyangium sp.]|nr:response regulator [Polyangium sp.]